jgi:glycogen debranching enzyme
MLQNPEAALGAVEQDTLVQRAVEVLEANWRGASTVPSPALYPHQWSWDSACIAIGYSHVSPERAVQELRSLFAGQWRNGMLPHIVFAEGQEYFPGPEFWQTDVSPDAPASRRTSGIVQAPVHAMSALRVFRNDADRERAESFLAEIFPKLEAWHDYLYRERDRAGDGLLEIWHPWESGMDNSPLWDRALARIDLDGNVPEYERIDRKIVDPAQRPTDREYDCYAYLVKLFRDLAYDGGAIREVFFNSCAVQANRDLAELARHAGADPERHERRAERTAAAMEQLWDTREHAYFDQDLRNGERIPVLAGSGFAPLHAGVPDEARAQDVVARMERFAVPVPAGWAVPTIATDDPAFEAIRYWRGPIWPIINWVAFRGLRRYGYELQAAQLRAGMLELAHREGLREHYNPLTARGQGGEQFAWTAALILDLLATQPTPDQNS